MGCFRTFRLGRRLTTIHLHARAQTNVLSRTASDRRPVGRRDTRGNHDTTAQSAPARCRPRPHGYGILTLTARGIEYCPPCTSMAHFRLVCRTLASPRQEQEPVVLESSPTGHASRATCLRRPSTQRVFATPALASAARCPHVPTPNRRQHGPHWGSTRFSMISAVAHTQPPRQDSPG